MRRRDSSRGKAERRELFPNLAERFLAEIPHHQEVPWSLLNYSVHRLDVEAAETRRGVGGRQEDKADEQERRGMLSSHAEGPLSGDSVRLAQNFDPLAIAWNPTPAFPPELLPRA